MMMDIENLHGASLKNYRNFFDPTHGRKLFDCRPFNETINPCSHSPTAISTTVCKIPGCRAPSQTDRRRILPVWPFSPSDFSARSGSKLPGPLARVVGNLVHVIQRVLINRI